MFDYKVIKSQSNENIPLLFSNKSEESIAKNGFITKSAFHHSKPWWSGSWSNKESQVIEEEGNDFAELNDCQAIIHIIKASIGTGVLALPSALRYSGLLIGSLAIVIISIISIYSMRLLLQVVAQLRLSSPEVINNLDYEKTVKLCFENANEKLRKYSWLHHALFASLAVAQIGFLSSYHIFVAENSKALLDNYIKDKRYLLPIWVYQLVFAVFLSPLLFIKTLDKLSYFTQFANFLMVVSLIISLVYCFQDPLPIKDLPLIKISDATPLFFGIIIFSFESINLLNPIESHLKKKKNILNICGVLNISTSIVLFSYLIIGISGYWKFGDNIASSIILSIPIEPWYYMLCKPFYIISILISYALQGYVMFNIIWQKIESKLNSRKFRTLTAITIRLGLVLITTVCSMAIPHFDLFISLVGAFSGSALTLIFPAICHSVMLYSNNKTITFKKIQLFINGMIFCLGIAGCVLGTYSSVINIFKVM